jgi:hypothetical protein
MEGVDIGMIATQFPTCVSLKCDAKELYKICDNPHDMVDKKTVEYLELKEEKSPSTPEIEF